MILPVAASAANPQQMQIIKTKHRRIENSKLRRRPKNNQKLIAVSRESATNFPERKFGRSFKRHRYKAKAGAVTPACRTDFTLLRRSVGSVNGTRSISPRRTQPICPAIRIGGRAKLVRGRTELVGAAAGLICGWRRQRRTAGRTRRGAGLIQRASR